MVVWVYSGGGYSELNGVIPWLQNQVQGVTFKRRTPQIVKPGPHPNATMAILKKPGLTGIALQEEIESDITAYWDGSAQVVLLLDDTDCDDPSNRSKSLTDAAMQALPTGSTVPIVVALAVPEIEAWILADWKNTFLKVHRGCAVPLKRRLVSEGVNFNSVHTFDCLCGTRKYRKLSDCLSQAFQDCCGPTPRYSKAKDTPKLLLKVDPKAVAAKCPHFRTFWHTLEKSLTPID